MPRTAPDGGTANIGSSEFDDGSWVCTDCGERMSAEDEANTEAFEEVGDLLCDDCAESLWERQAEADS